MTKFGHVYIGRRLVTYELDQRVIQGRSMYVASLSEDPQLEATSTQEEGALAMLLLRMMERFGQKPSANPVPASVTLLPPTATPAVDEVLHHW